MNVNQTSGQKHDGGTKEDYTEDDIEDASLLLGLKRQRSHSVNVFNGPEIQERKRQK
jgi:hypothetical protein